MTDSPIEIVLHVPEEPQQAGERVPVRVDVRNTSSQPLWIIGVLEGSEVGFRYPHYLPSITGPEPIPEPEQLPHFGNVAPLLLDDFHRLEPGASFDPTRSIHGAHYHPLHTFQAFRPPVAGRYTVQLTLSTESHDPTEWLGIIETPDKAAILDRLAEVPRLRVASAPVTVEVQGD
jgi:hypothetical protein